MNYSRRDLGLVLPALAATAATAAAEPGNALPSKAYKYEDLPVKVNGQNKARAVLNGETHSGFAVEMHLTELGPGQAPHPPHKHVHEELLMLQTGMLDVTITGQTTRVNAGSVVFLASNDEHGWRNPGTERAQYFVIALGKDS
ncbi:MAG TPA: cupin domain-containing protein [Bryobacteraceae bacterium]